MLVGMLRAYEQDGAGQSQRTCAVSDSDVDGTDPRSAPSSVSWDTLLDRDRAFELFRQGHPGGVALQETADLLRMRCLEARTAGQQVGLHGGFVSSAMHRMKSQQRTMCRQVAAAKGAVSMLKEQLEHMRLHAALDQDAGPDHITLAAVQDEGLRLQVKQVCKLPYPCSCMHRP